LESKDLICRVKTDLKLPIDEKPELMRQYMHKRMAQQAQHSLNKGSVAETVLQEVSRQRIKKLRELHHDLIGIKKLTNNSTFNNVRINPEFRKHTAKGTAKTAKHQTGSG
jgi:CRISPR/Cas system-associated endoribonuclease Cas2